MTGRELEIRMREVLLALAMTSSARTSTLEAGRGGSSHPADYTLIDDNGRGRLDADDAPHLRFAAVWDAARDDDARAAALQAARDELDAIRHSRALPAASETGDELRARIVREAEGFSAKDTAIAMRTGIKLVWRAREAAGRDREFGRPLHNGRVLDDEDLNAEILQMHRRGVSQRVIAQVLHTTRARVRCLLARHT